MPLQGAPTTDETIYSRLVDGTQGHAIYALDPHGHILTWGPAAVRTWGHEAADILGRHVSCLYTAEDNAAGKPDLALAAARARGRFELSSWRVRRDGERVWMHISLSCLHDEAGAVIGFAVVARDGTVEHRENVAALEKERRFGQLVQGVTDFAIYMLDPQGLVTNWNTGAERAKGYRAEEIVGSHVSQFYTEEERGADLPQLALATARACGRFEGEGWRVRKDGTRFWAHAVIEAVRDQDGRFIGFAKITRDVTARKYDADRLAHATRTLDLALSHMKHGLCVFDGSELLHLANRRFLDMFGQPRDSTLIGLTFEEIARHVVVGPTGPGPQGGEAADLFYRRHIALMREGGEVTVVEDMPNGTALSISHARMPDGSWVCTFEDVTQRKRAEATISKLAAQDSLTGLANRREFRQRLAALPGASATTCAVLLIDLDDFKSVNDTYGHAAGDAVLRHVADAVGGCIRAGDVAARLGGDEFAVVLHDVSQAQAAALAERLLSSVRKPCPVGANLVAQVGVSIGIALGTTDAWDCDGHLMQADIALYEVKGCGKGGYRFYSSEMNAAAIARREMEADLRGSVTTGSGFTLHYQPVIDIGTGRVTAREALLRWQHPRQGSVPPSVFIPLAEEMGLIGRLGAFVLRQACGDARDWGDGARVAVNVSPLQLGGGDFLTLVLDALAASGLPAERLEVEVTETTLLDDGSGKLDDLHRLHDLGVRVALDDFGIGFSSLAHVRAFPFDRIKIDGSFVRDAVHRPDCAIIVGIVADLGRRLGIVVVAEGVETEDHLDLARRQGCHEVQGFLLGRPEPAESVAGQSKAA